MITSIFFRFRKQLAWLQSGILVTPNLSRYCVEEVDSTTGAVTAYMGKCGLSGSVYNGHRTNDVRVYWLFGIAVNEEKVFISLYGNMRIVQMVGDVVTVLTDTEYEVRHLTLLADGMSMFFSYDFGVGFMNVVNSSSITYITGTASLGSVLGNLEESRFGYMSEVLPLSEKLIMFSQRDDSRLVYWLGL